MGRPLKYALWGLGSLAGLLVAGAALALLLIDPNAHKGRIQELVREHTGRSLDLKGPLHVGLYPWLAIETGEATLGNAPGFGAAPMVELRHARLGVRLWPLLSGRVEFGTVAIDGPVVRLAVDRVGRGNWADLAGSDKQESTPAAPRAGLDLSLAGLRVTDGSIEYRDESAGTHYVLRGLALDAGALRGSGAAGARTISLDGLALRFQVAGGGLPAAGLPVQLEAGQATLGLDDQSLRLPGLAGSFAGAGLKGEVAASKLFDAPAFSGPVRLEVPVLREFLQRCGVEPPVTRDGKVLGRVVLEGRLAAGAHAFMLEGLKGSLDDTTFSGRAGLRDLDRSSMVVALALDQFDADRYLPPPEPQAPAAAAGAAGKESPPVPLPVDLLRKLDLHGSLSLKRARFSGLNYSDVRLGVDAAGGHVRVAPSEARLYGGRYRGELAIDATGVPVVTFNEQLSGVDFAPLLADLYDTRRFSGRGNATLRGTASGADSAQLLRTLNGAASFRVDGGAYEGTDLWFEIRRARALVQGHELPAPTGTPRTAFTALSGSARITNGVLASDDLVAALQYLKVQGRGSANLDSGALDFHLDATAVQVPEKDPGAADAAALQGLTVPVTVTGTFAAPKVRPDLEGYAKARARQELDKRKDELRQKLSDKLKQLLGH